MSKVLKITQKQEEAYRKRKQEAREEFEQLADEYFNHEIDQDEYEDKMKAAIIAYLVAIAMIAAGPSYSFTSMDITDLSSFSQDMYDLLEQMVRHVSDRSQFTIRYIQWRAGLFSHARGVFVRFSMPRDVWSELPEMPGDNCLGDGACGCSWRIEVTDETIEAYWVLGTTEHCTVCKVNAATYNPYVISSGF